MSDKHDLVAKQIERGPLAGMFTDPVVDEIAEILRREYGNVRAEAFAEAARIADTAASDCRGAAKDVDEDASYELESRAEECEALAAAIRKRAKETP